MQLLRSSSPVDLNVKNKRLNIFKFPHAHGLETQATVNCVGFRTLKVAQAFLSMLLCFYELQTMKNYISTFNFTLIPAMLSVCDSVE